MATYRGMDGSISLGTNVVGEARGWEWQGSLEPLDTTILGNVARTRRTGLQDWTARVTAHFDYGDTLGQKVLMDAMLGVTPNGAVANIRLRIDPAKYLVGACVFTQIPITAELGNIITGVFNFMANGPATIVWA